jgi:hypothetical protein
MSKIGSWYGGLDPEQVPLVWALGLLVLAASIYTPSAILLSPSCAWEIMSNSLSPSKASYSPLPYILSAMGFLLVPLAVGVGISALIQRSVHSQLRAIEQNFRTTVQELFPG